MGTFGSKEVPEAMRNSRRVADLAGGAGDGDVDGVVMILL